MSTEQTDTTSMSTEQTDQVKSVDVHTPRIHNVIVASIQPDNKLPTIDPKTDKASEWFITYIRDGQQCVKPCIEEVWLWVQHAKPWCDTRVDWIINVDRNADDKVVGVKRKPRLDQGPLSPRLDIDPTHLMLQKSGATFDPINLPIEFATPVLEEAIKAMDDVGNAKVGDILAKKFQVKKVIAMDDSKIFALAIL